MAVSVYLRSSNAGELQIEVDGGRYERCSGSIGGTAATFWRRRPVSARIEVPLADVSDQSRRVSGGPLLLELGISTREHGDGRIVTAYLVNRTHGGGDLASAAAATLFQATLRLHAPTGVIVDYPTGNTPEGEGRSLDLLYHGQSVRAVGHGCDAIYRESPAGATVTVEHFP